MMNEGGLQPFLRSKIILSLIFAPFGTVADQRRDEIDPHRLENSKSCWKPLTASTEVRAINTHANIAVKWPSNTHKPSCSIIPMDKSTTAQAGRWFENGMGNGNIRPRPAITMAKPISCRLPGPACRKAKRGRTNFSSWRAILTAPVRSWVKRAGDRRRRIMKRGSDGSRPITRQAPIKHMAIPKGMERPGIGKKQNGNASRISSTAGPRPLRACFNSAKVSDLPFNLACSISGRPTVAIWDCFHC
jgi:hypothetical protein